MSPLAVALMTIARRASLFCHPEAFLFLSPWGLSFLSPWGLSFLSPWGRKAEGSLRSFASLRMTPTRHPEAPFFVALRPQGRRAPEILRFAQEDKEGVALRPLFLSPWGRKAEGPLRSFASLRKTKRGSPWGPFFCHPEAVRPKGPWDPSLRSGRQRGGHPEAPFFVALRPKGRRVSEILRFAQDDPHTSPYWFCRRLF